MTEFNIVQRKKNRYNKKRATLTTGQSILEIWNLQWRAFWSQLQPAATWRVLAMHIGESLAVP